MNNAQSMKQPPPPGEPNAGGISVKPRELARVKHLATGLLALAAVMYITTALLSARYPVLAFVAATCEAAMVGALADWFAVVALFRHPLNVPLPHTAIIPRNKARIAQGMGEFIQAQFLTTTALVAKIREVNPAARLSEWLLKPASAETLASYATRFLAYALNALDDRRVREFLRGTLTARLYELDIASLAGRILDVLTENKRHHALLDEALASMHEFLSSDETRQYIAGEISKQWPLIRWLTESLQLDRMAAGKILDFAIAKLGEMRIDREHELRKRFDAYVEEFIAKLKADPSTREKIEQLRDDVLRNAATADYLGRLWSDLRAWLEADLREERSAVHGKLVELMRALATQLDADAEIKDWINEQILDAVPPFVAEHRASVGRFIERQVNTWQDEKLVQELELHIGVDLQYIRINGTLVGGAAGLIIYSLTRFAAG